MGIAQLSSREWSTLGTQLAQLKRLEHVTRALENAGIEALVLKGAAFLETLYSVGEMTSRPMADVDLLVRAHDLPRSRDVMNALGYTWITIDDNRRLTAEECFEWVFVDRSAAVPVVFELHRGFCREHHFTPDYDGVWQRSVWIDAPQRRVHTLCPEDTLLYLALHQAKHSFVWDDRAYRDVARVIERWTVDWSVVVKRAAEWNVRLALYVMLTVSKRIHRCDVPVDVCSSLKPGTIRGALLDAVLDMDGSGKSRFSEEKQWVKLVTSMCIIDRPTHFARYVLDYGWLRLREIVR